MVGVAAASQGPGRRRAPFGVAAVAVALVAFLPVWGFDALEGILGDRFPEGPQVLLMIVGLFAAVWFLVGSALLAFASPAPEREGLLAGGLVALAMLVILVSDRDIPWLLVAILWAIFGGLAFGCGAVAGVIASRIQGGQPAGGWSRAAGVAAIGCAAIIGLLVFLLFAPPNGGFAAFTLVLVGLLAGVGTWGLLRRRLA
jgi:hypothetical protein